MTERTDDSDSFEPLGEPHEVEPLRTRGQGLRLAVSLVLAGLVIGGIVAAGTTVVGGFAQTEAGLCRITWASCTELSLNSVESLSGLDFPEGTAVVSGFSRESSATPEFRAEVILPEGAQFTLSTGYDKLEEPQPGLVPAAENAQLSGVRYWSRFKQGAGSTAAAAQGVDEQGRTVILFDTHRLE
ncbi:MAG: hypothetical protein ACOH1U_02265 [Rhodoglobus sp.]